MEHWTWLILATIGLVVKLWIITAVSEGQDYYEGKFGIFTDLDYKVFLDASLYPSPYERHTYRYSPILSYIFSPSYKFDQRFGKYLVAFLDIFAAYYYYKIMYERKEGDKQRKKTEGLIISMFTYLHPFVIFLGTRGSCEGITMTIASAFMYYYFSPEVHGNMSPQQRIQKGLTERQPNKFKKYLSYVIFGFWVHFRVYPIIFVPLLIMHEYYSVKENKLKHALKFTLQLGLVAGGVFLGLAAFFYYLYGYEFLFQTYLYHLTRRDNRHSKSLFFYDLYLNYESDALFKPLYRVICRNLSTIVLLVAFSFYFSKKRSVFYCMGFFTVYFILFNRVITDQYYIWLFYAAVLIASEGRLFKAQKYGQTLWWMTKCMLTCVPTMVIWGVFNNQFQNANPQCHVLLYWMVNILNIVTQVFGLTKFSTDQLVILDKETKRPIKND